MTVIVNIKAQSNANLNLKVRTSFAETKERIDFTGYVANMEIRERKDGHVVLATLSSDTTKNADGTIEFFDDGVFVLDLAPSILLNQVKIGTWYYDVVLTRPDGLEVRWIEGKFTVDGSTTIENLSTVTGLSRRN